MLKASAPAAETSRENFLRALSVIDAAGKELSGGVFAKQTQSKPLESITLPSEAEASRRSALGIKWRKEIAAIDLKLLPDEIAQSILLANATAERLEHELPWYWHVHDPLGLGFFGLFGPTAYGGGWHLSVLAQQLGRHQFLSSGDAERYLGLVIDLSGVVRCMRERLKGQIARGIVMPIEQLRQARTLLAALAPSIERQVDVAPERLTRISHTEAFTVRLRTLIDRDLHDAFRKLGADLEDANTRWEADTVGMASYPGGLDIYTDLVRLHTSLDLEVDQVHATGRARIAEIQEQMAAIRAEVGFNGDNEAFWAAIGRDPEWRATTAEGVADRFRDCIQRVEPLLHKWFYAKPASPYGVEPLPDALTGAMTFGYYRVPATPSETGRYLFNARNLTQSALAHVPALTFHELVPGHHVHLAGQAQDAILPALHKFNSFNAFNEGWAEYAAALAGEQGLYKTPEERFGRLRMDAFLTCRLVVDTGLNAFGWGLQQAQAYLHNHGFMTEDEACSESIRYACDLPGQSLAYKLGDTFLFAQRERMREALGAHFDLRDFHQTVLQGGAMPLPLVAAQIDRAISRIKRPVILG